MNTENSKRADGSLSGNGAAPGRRVFCDKVTYPSEQWARQALDLRSSHPRGPKRPRLRTYYCERCGLWHLTSMSLEVWQAEPAKRKTHHQIRK